MHERDLNFPKVTTAMKYVYVDEYYYGTHTILGTCCNLTIKTKALLTINVIKGKRHIVPNAVAYRIHLRTN